VVKHRKEKRREAKDPLEFEDIERMKEIRRKKRQKGLRDKRKNYREDEEMTEVFKKKVGRKKRRSKLRRDLEEEDYEY